VAQEGLPVGGVHEEVAPAGQPQDGHRMAVVALLALLVLPDHHHAGVHSGRLEEPRDQDGLEQALALSEPDRVHELEAPLEAEPRDDRLDEAVEPGARLGLEPRPSSRVADARELAPALREGGHEAELLVACEPGPRLLRVGPLQPAVEGGHAPRGHLPVRVGDEAREAFGSVGVAAVGCCRPGGHRYGPSGGSVLSRRPQRQADHDSGEGDGPPRAPRSEGEA
jgi:hypothetical protein